LKRPEKEALIASVMNECDGMTAAQQRVPD
jgi:hypothetical protein